MKAMTDLTLALLAAGAPGLAAFPLVTIALFLTGPIRLNLSIGERSRKRRG